MDTRLKENNFEQEQPQTVMVYGTMSSSNTRPQPTVIFSPSGYSYNDISQGTSKVFVHEPSQRQTYQDEEEPEGALDSPIESLAIQPDFIVATTINENNPLVQANKIVEAFNRNNTGPKALTKSSSFTFWRGKRIQPYEFLLAHHNFQPELATHSRDVVVTTTSFFNWTFHSEMIGFYQLSQRFFGAYGRHVLQVGAGEYAKVIQDGNYFLYDEGVHIIASANVVFNINTDFVKKSVDHIEHGDIHVLRVRTENIAMLELGGRARFLPTRNEVYLFQDSSFKFDGYANAAEKYIGYKNLKYINPGVNEVAVVRRHHEVAIIPSRVDGKPTILDLSTDIFLGMVSLESQTLEYPREETKNKKLKENLLSPNENIHYSYFTTADCCEIGIKTTIQYKIIHPLLIINHNIEIAKVAEYIENLTSEILSEFIKNYELSNMLNSNNSSRSIPSSTMTPENYQINMSAAPPILGTIEDTLAWELFLRLQKIGIEFIKLNFQIRNTADNITVKIARAAISFFNEARKNIGGQPQNAQVGTSSASDLVSMSYTK